jgi:hypothetical protein
MFQKRLGSAAIAAAGRQIRGQGKPWRRDRVARALLTPQLTLVLVGAVPPG